MARAGAYLVLLGASTFVWPHHLGGPVTLLRVAGTSMEPGLHTGDLGVLYEADTYQVGDVIGYRVPDDQFGGGNLVIHRITGGNAQDGWRTQGDNRTSPDPWLPTDRDIAGRLVWSTPGGGTLLSRAAEPLPLGLLCGGLTVLVLAWPDRRRKDEAATLPLSPALAPRVVVRRTTSTCARPTDLPGLRPATRVAATAPRVVIRRTERTCARPADLPGMRPITAVVPRRVHVRSTTRRAWTCTDLPETSVRVLVAA